jgi:pyruvate dehydrogenase E1 component
MTVSDHGVAAAPEVHPEVLDAVARRLLWLAVRMVDTANHDRPPGEVKVGGHQASSASMIGIMTALWFGHLRREDKVAVKPHASPVYHAIKYLTGELDRSYLTRLREFGGLQAYPSRTKDPDVFDFSTGSVGLGAVAPLFAAAVRRYVEHHFGAADGAGTPRFVALVGDAELDEGNVWEAIADPALQGLGNVMWVIDVNRQSLDRVIPGLKIRRLMRFFAESGWHVVEAKYGARLEAAFARPGGEALRSYIDDMSNEQYQSYFATSGRELRDRFLASAPSDVKRFLDDYGDDDLAPLLHNLGGHDHGVLLDAYRQCDAETDRPSVVFAYTVKGWGLPVAGDPLNHAALLTPKQVDALRAEVGLTVDDEWDRFDPSSPEGALCQAVGGELNNEEVPTRPAIAIPAQSGAAVPKTVSTQETFGRVLAALASHEEVAKRLVTTSPDVSISTNLGGWINKVGVFAPEEQPDYLGTDRLLRWHQHPQGRHIELGISEMNLFLLLHALGLGHELHGRHLLPIGTVYDPFICRGLDALVYALYNDARFIVVGTPAGITLAPEGGAHQSTITPSIGLELPGLTYIEPAYGAAVDWLLCDALERLGPGEGGTSTYLRLSTRPLDQAPFEEARRRLGEDELRRAVVAGGYRLVEPTADGDDGRVMLAAAGAVMPEVLQAARILEEEGVAVTVVDVTSPDRLYRGWRQGLRDAARDARAPRSAGHLGTLLLGPERTAPIVTVHDAASHALAWLGSVFGATTLPVGVDGFGQSGSIADLYAAFDLTADQIATTALVALAGA